MSLKVRAKALTVINAFVLSRRALPALHTQGDALGYVLVGLSCVPSVASDHRSSAGRLSGTCG